MRGAVGDREQRDHHRHEVGREAGERQRGDVDGAQARRRRRAQMPSGVGDTSQAHLAELHRHDLEVLEPRAVDGDLAAGDAARHEQRAGLDAVAHDLAVDRHERRRRPRSRSSTFPRPITCAPMRLRNAARSVISGSRAAFSMTVVPLASTAAVSRFSVAPTLGNSSTIARRRRARSRARLDEAVHDVDLGAHRLEAAEVHVELAAPDVVAAGHRDRAPRRSAPRSGPSTLTDARMRRDELVGRLGLERARRVDRAARRSPVHSTLGADARAARRSSRRGRRRGRCCGRGDAGREQRRRHLLQPGVLGRARDAHRTRQGHARGDHERVGHLRHRTRATHRSLGEAEGDVVEVEDPTQPEHRDRLHDARNDPFTQRHDGELVARPRRRRCRSRGSRRARRRRTGRDARLIAIPM